jgi:hypothetical protein
MAWERWFDALGTSLLHKGKAVFVGGATGDTGQGNSLGGYSLITTENIDAAVELAKSCPIVTCGGGVEVGELTAWGAITPPPRAEFPPRWHPPSRR